VKSLLALCAAACCAAPLAAPAAALAGDKRSDDVAAIADLIDRHVAADLKANQVRPADVCSDATFLRRVYLDLTGCIPPINKVRDFLDDTDPHKRGKLVRSLLESKEYARFSAAVWYQTLIPPSSNPLGFRGSFATPLESWLAENIKDNTPYDKMVAQLIVALGTPADRTGANEFVTAAESKPENVAAATARVFLGVKIECAHCHDHPFAKWKKQQFWEQAAFFSGLNPPSSGAPAIAIPGGNKTVAARFLDGTDPNWKQGDDPRRLLADWMVRADNQYFAPAAVNRVWARFMGFGLVDPVDEFGENNPASHPKLLEELSKHFAATGFDQRLLVEGILNSRTYQLESRQTDESQADLRRYGRRAVRGLMPEQVFDSMAVVSDGGVIRQPGTTPTGQTSRVEFLQRFPLADHPAESQTSVLQSLYRMNGPLVTVATRPETNPALKHLADRAADNPERCVDELYLLALSRRPDAGERDRMVKYLKSGGPDGDPRKALGDVLWVLLNSSEFYLYH
jgi:hypothetical protein